VFDVADKKILSALFADARKPFSAIARECAVSREVVEYRIEKLVAEGIITGFIARISQVYFCSGVGQLRVKLIRADAKRFEEIVTAVREHHSVNWAAELCGTADLILTIFFVDPEHLARTISELMQTMGDLVREQDVALYITEHKYDLRGLIKQDSISTYSPVVFKGPTTGSLDKKDLLILQMLAKNCRTSYVALAQKVSLSEESVRQRIRALEKNKVILGHTILIDAAACNYEQYYMRFFVEQFTPALSSKLNYYVRANPYITYCCETVGNYNVVMTVAARNHKHFLEILLDIRKQFGALLTDYEFQIIVRELKGVYVPDEFLRTQKRI
jgi:Lrp/AsnC family transcriptional regulator, regulator for asnA, asnC and gidA